MSEAGLISLCSAFPNLETLVLAHGKYTDEAVAHVGRLKKLKGLEIGSTSATPACLKSIVGLPLEYLQIGSEFDHSTAVPIIREIQTLRRLSLTYCVKLTDDDLRLVAAMKYLESLELGNLELNEERLPLLKNFAHLKMLRVTNPRKPYDEATRAAVQAALPGVAITFQ